MLPLENETHRTLAPTVSVLMGRDGAQVTVIREQNPTCHVREGVTDLGSWGQPRQGGDISADEAGLDDEKVPPSEAGPEEQPEPRPPGASQSTGWGLGET